MLLTPEGHFILYYKDESHIEHFPEEIITYQPRGMPNRKAVMSIVQNATEDVKVSKEVYS